MIRVVIPYHLKNLANVKADEVELEVSSSSPPTIGAVLESLEAKYPVLRGTIRDHGTLKRRPFLRFFACNRDFSLEQYETELPAEVVEGREPFIILGGIAGG